MKNEGHNEIQAGREDHHQTFLYLKESKNNSLPNAGTLNREPLSFDIAEGKKFAGRYFGRDELLDVMIDNSSFFKFNDLDSYPVQFISPNECRLGQNVYRFMADHMPPYIVKTNDGFNWDYNDGPTDPPGLAKPEWNSFVGAYEAVLWGEIPKFI